MIVELCMRQVAVLNIMMVFSFTVYALLMLTFIMANHLDQTRKQQSE